MKIRTNNFVDNKSGVVANQVTQKQNNVESSFQFADNRPEALIQRELREISNNGTKVSQFKFSQLTHAGKKQNGETGNKTSRHNNSTIIQRKEGDTINGVIQKRGSDNKLAIYTNQIRPWFEIPEGSDVKENDKVKFIEGSERSVTKLEVTKEMPNQDIDKMNCVQLYKAFYELMVINAPAQLVEKYWCKGEVGENSYSKEYRFLKVDNLILHIHWEKSNSKKTDVARAHIKRKADKFKIEKSTSLSISELQKLGVPVEGNERLFERK